MNAPELSAPVCEIFSSVQGEGIYLGQKQIFVRFAGCNLDCGYCDEPAAKSTGTPRTLSETAEEIEKLFRKEPAAAVSLTGGEPLLHTAFIAGLIPAIKRLGMSVYLETNATLPLAFKLVSEETDVVAADIKLPSATGRSNWEAHERFFRLCPDKLFVKIVLTDKTTRDELAAAAALLRRVSGKIPLVLQPATENDGAKPPAQEAIDGFRALASAQLADVRVLAQQHPLWGVK